MKTAFQYLFAKIGNVKTAGQIDDLYVEAYKMHHQGHIGLKEMETIHHAIFMYKDVMGWL